MPSLTVDRIHGRYAVADPGDADRLDAWLARVVADDLDRALAGRALHPADHVCVRAVRAPVTLDVRGPEAAATRAWADAIVASVAGAVAAGDGVVVYPRTLDALVDLVASLGRGETGRAWAWRQVGLLDSTTAGVIAAAPAVAAALVARPDAAPAALVAAATRGPVPLSTAGWVAVARAVRGLTGPLEDDPGPGGPDDDTVAGWIARGPVARLLPAAAVTAADDRDALASLAGLAVACAAPARSRQPALVAAVARALTLTATPAGADPAPRPEPRADPLDPLGPLDPAPAAPGPGAADTRSAAPADPSSPPGPGPATAPDPAPASLPPAGRDPAVAGPGPDQPGPAGRVLPVTGLGGLLFAVPAVTDLDLPTRLAAIPWPRVAADLARRLAGAAADDPVVGVLAGPPGPDGDDRGPAPGQVEALAAAATDVDVWLRSRVAAEPGDDLGWLWRRRATLAVEPGWVEVGLALDDVDTRTRRAGLDLDPGYVWWLGAVVRFRYA